MSSEETIGELPLLRELLPKLKMRDDVLVGPGDDCAVLCGVAGWDQLAAVDSVVGDVHFFLATTAPEAAGAKLLKRNLSDIAAMGGEACWALVAVNQRGCSGEWLRRFYDGLETCARHYGVALVGGDYGSLASPGVAASLTIIGRIEHEKAILRSGACAGDVLYVTGILGDTLTSEHHLNFEPRLAEGRWLAQTGYARAMMDVSDGLGSDARRMAEASGVGFEVDLASLPCRGTVAGALSDGEDYELLLAVPEGRASQLEMEWPFGTRLSRIGRAVAQPAGELIEAGSGRIVRAKGYEHTA